MCYCIALIHINTRWYVFFCCESSDIFRKQILGAQRSDIKTICLARPKTFCDGRCKTCSAIMRLILCSSSEGPSPAVLYISPLYYYCWIDSVHARISISYIWKTKHFKRANILAVFSGMWCFTLKHWPAEARFLFLGDVTVPCALLAKKLTLAGAVACRCLVGEPLDVTVTICEGICATLSNQNAGDEASVAVRNQELVSQSSVGKQRAVLNNHKQQPKSTLHGWRKHR